MAARSILLWLGVFAHHSTVSLAASSHSSSATSSAALLADPPALTLADADSPTRYLCTPLTQCLACLPTELDTPVCKVWGNKRQLSCQVYKSLNPSPIDDPDAQHGVDRHPTTLTPTSSSSSTETTTTRSENAPSQFYEYEPGRNAANDDDDLFEGHSDARGKAAGETQQQESEEVLAELREVLNAERRKRQRARRRSEPDGETFVVTLERRAGDEDRRIETYEACPKVVKREQSDYFEFVLCNLFFALAGLAVLLYRQRTLAGRQFGKLVARIMQTEIR